MGTRSALSPGRLTTCRLASVVVVGASVAGRLLEAMVSTAVPRTRQLRRSVITPAVCCQVRSGPITGGSLAGGYQPDERGQVVGVQPVGSGVVERHDRRARDRFGWPSDIHQEPVTGCVGSAMLRMRGICDGE
jgi:hypothetical protein